MSYHEIKFRSEPGYYTRADVERQVSENRPLRRFTETLEFALARYNRGRETMRYEIRSREGGGRGIYDVDFWLNDRRDLCETGSLNGDLISFEQLTSYHLGSRSEILQVLPRLGRLLMEKEYGHGPRP